MLEQKLRFFVIVEIFDTFLKFLKKIFLNKNKLSKFAFYEVLIKIFEKI